MVVHATRVIDSNWPIKSLSCISVVIISILFLDNLHLYCIRTRDQCSCSHCPMVDCLQKSDSGQILGTRLQYGVVCSYACKSVRIHSRNISYCYSAILSCFHAWPVESGCPTYPLHISGSFEVYLLKWTRYARKIIFHFLFDDVLYFSNTCRPHQSFCSAGSS